MSHEAIEPLAEITQTGSVVVRDVLENPLSEIEDILAHSPIKRSVPLRTVSSNASTTRTDKVFVELEAGVGAIFLSESDALLVPLCKHERAAYVIACATGFGALVPPTFLRKVESGVGSIQLFVPNAQTGLSKIEELSDKEKDQLVEIALFDAIIQNNDRLPTNILKRGDRLFAIDHEDAFGELLFSTYESGIVAGRAIPRHIMNDFVAFCDDVEKRDALRAQLVELLPPMSITECFGRIDKLRTVIVSGYMPHLQDKSDVHYESFRRLVV